MDDSCAVCADTLEWVAYGPCGHRDVCSTCVARLRFICEDRRCCICKTESNLVFVTKALGDYTRMINDFSLLPSGVKEGRVGSYWYHEDTQAFFDDVDHYRMIRAMCKLSCSICDKTEEQSNDASKRRRTRFRNIDQLKGHLFHKHRSFMCSLCLEGRKVFICEQKLYTRAQLNQHISTGDSEVDGTESERGGFSGHPMCEFCRTPFYGDNELYSHMSTEHYTCHICQRQHPGQYEYYKNYDDLEIHFRQSHFLCEDEACLAKKFVVFQSEAEMKRHNTVEHGGRMSRSKRNAALQIPTSFRYRRSNEQDHHRGRGRTFRREVSDNQLSLAIEASLETAIAESSTFNDPSLSSVGQFAPDIGDASDIDSIVQPFELLDTAESETSSRYLQALGHNSRNKPLEESSFPPLSTGPGSSQFTPNSRNKPLEESPFPPLSTGSGSSQFIPKQDSDGLPNKTMAVHLRRQSNHKATVLNSGHARPASSRGPSVPPNNSAEVWPPASRGPLIPPNNSAEAWPAMNNMSGPSLGSSQNKTSTGNAPAPSTYAASTQTRPTTFHGLHTSGSTREKGNTGRIIHSASAPNLVENGFTEPSILDFPPVSVAAQPRKLPSSTQAPQNSEEVHNANKSLVEKIRAALEYDEDKYTAFKDISGQYRQGLIDSARYLSFVREFCLLHLVLDLARLCPDPQKQRELIETYNASVRSNIDEGNDWAYGGSGHMKDGNGSRKGKGKNLNSEDITKDSLADNFISSVQKLQSSYNKPLEEDAEVLSKDGYRSAKGKSKLKIDDQQVELLNNHSRGLMKPGGLKNLPSTGSGKSGDGGGGSKQRKKTSKFHRVRLGDGSAAALLDSHYSDSHSDSDPTQEALTGDGNSSGGLPVRGVWRNGGGQKLFS
ncbi:zinc finger protein [Parasponia andersonii]|uniref:RING-type E3 ubiquitin transferase n=1 Tax=Parasponia andersonii TaxID=3476 RepID=A0A2P5B339_PARAD|nr:zinc finger protein [Parasponia andersonii]